MSYRGSPIIVKATPESLTRIERVFNAYILDAESRRINRQINGRRQVYAEERSSMESGWPGPDLGGES